MSKKILFSLIAAASMQAAAMAKGFNGFYAGGGVGYATMSSGTKRLGATDNYSKNSNSVSLSGGYGYAFDNNLYVGAEYTKHYFGQSKHNIKGYPESISVGTARLDHSLLAQFGYKINDSFVTYVTTGAALGTMGMTYADSVKTQLGFQYGVGVKYLINESFSIAGEISRVNFSSGRLNDSEVDEDTGDVTSMSYRVPNAMNLASVKFAYHF